MLRQLLCLDEGADSSRDLTREIMTITNFNLLPGGISRGLRSQDNTLNQRFSETVLESMKLVLDSILIRKMAQVPEEMRGKEGGTYYIGLTETQWQINFIDDTRKAGNIMMGGHFPQIIAQKSTKT